ncbi:methylenetetrahydrofolate reductase C-terminal domain-containing protein [Cellulomonas bogoriensis]|uniref:Methylenetetrahydrofolate reductase n=1 Tax=Cellulomonas bogoriensis 69B4 = DSM 16987 TaxID=1386082 RepID=A0A0A0BMA0_9CELL|nr:methylenetetrahydrofolate reductase C-terminal domain-containing protein [Cellulomonas bogoriensis]KGM09086.1 methylenetetrahydrofolate reductase [Cellulomonas bogoriensis 69B4 = DSM 16987]
MTTTAPAPLPLLDVCPKRMQVGPCGGVAADGGCEVRPAQRCTFLGGQPHEGVELPARRVPGEVGVQRGSGRFEAGLAAGRFMVVTEVNGADSADASEFTAAAVRLAQVADVVSITDHSGANVHMGNVAATAHLLAAGVETMPTFTCRDRNRMALQGDLLGVSSLGAQNVLLVSGNHVDVGDSPDAAPVFDLDSTRLIGVAARLRDEGVLDNGRRVDVAPSYLIAAAAHPFAPPYERRAEQVVRKVRAGADVLITQHVFDLPLWRSFLADVQAARPDAPPFHLLAGVAVLPDEATARRVNAGLRGFSIPEATLDRLRRSPDPAREGVRIAAETVQEMRASGGVSGVLLAPVTGRTNALAASDEQVDIVSAVLQEAGMPVTAAARAGVAS